MAAMGGSIESISLRGRLFSVAADADAKLKLGGSEIEIQANGDGTVRYIKIRMPWSLTDVTVSVDHDRADQEFLQELADSTEEVPIGITLVNGVTYQGTGLPLGELAYSTGNATCSLGVGGSGKAEQQ